MGVWPAVRAQPGACLLAGGSSSTWLDGTRTSARTKHEHAWSSTRTSTRTQTGARPLVLGLSFSCSCSTARARPPPSRPCTYATHVLLLASFSPSGLFSPSHLLLAVDSARPPPKISPRAKINREIRDPRGHLSNRGATNPPSERKTGASWRQEKTARQRRWRT